MVVLVSLRIRFSLLFVVHRGPWYDVTTGKEVPNAEVEAGMERERQSLKACNVYTPATQAEFDQAIAEGLKPEVVNSGWVLNRRSTGVVKCKLAATQINWGTLADTFSSTPSACASRLLLSFALNFDYPDVVGDVATAFLHGPLPLNC